MNLEQQVCSLDLAKRLKELGVKQESQFYWRCAATQHIKRASYLWFANGAILKQEMLDAAGEVSAFTVAELGEMLPMFVKEEKYSLRYSFWTARVNDGNEWGCAYEGEHSNLGGYVFIADTEADARAKMLVYLLENKLVTV
jgi:hypothetical protein